MNAAPAAPEAAAADNVPVPVRRGPKFTMAEDYDLCRAFVSASEDPIAGTNQKSADFKQKFYTNYVTLVTETGARIGKVYSNRTSLSCMNRFKKISKLVLKMIGVIESCGEPPSGDTEREVFDNLVTETFVKRYPDGAKCVDSVHYCMGFLENKPKWKSYQEAEEQPSTSAGKKRPTGSKQAKQAKEDQETLKSVLATAASVSSSKKQKRDKGNGKYLKKMGTSVEAVAVALQGTMAERNEIALLNCIASDQKREKYAVQLLKSKIATNNAKASGSGKVSIGSSLTIDVSSDSDDSDSDDESEVVVANEKDTNEKDDSAGEEDEDERDGEGNLMGTGADGSLIVNSNENEEE